jgi:hypothetical protein
MLLFPAIKQKQERREERKEESKTSTQRIPPSSPKFQKIRLTLFFGKTEIAKPELFYV